VTIGPDRKAWLRADGQSMIEFAIVLPLIVILALGVVEMSSALLDQHVVTRLTREGSNLISRDTTLGDAAAALRSMATRPVDFNSNSTAILSVIMSPATTGTTNYNTPILYQRLQFGAISAASALSTRGSGSYGGAPDYQATNPNGDSNLQITNLPANLTVPLGGFLYVTEIYTQHPLMTPLDRFGINVPTTLYSVAYF
jgi:hypothetical protein